MDKSKLDKPLYCQDCGKEFLVKRFRCQLPMIIDYCILEKLKQKLDLLNKAEQMYHDYPESKDKMIPEIFFDKKSAPTSEEIRMWTKGNKLLEEFLLSTSFNLKASRGFVEKRIEDKSKSIEPITCPECNKGIIIFKTGRLSEYEPKLSR